MFYEQSISFNYRIWHNAYDLNPISFYNHAGEEKAYLPRTVLSCRRVIECINIDKVFLSFGVFQLFLLKKYVLSRSEDMPHTSVA